MSILDVKDRVPTNVLSNNAVRYGIYDENGKLIRYEYIKREDEPVEEGTAINRALFNNIQGDLYTSDRYNKPVIVEEQKEAFILGNVFPTAWRAVVTGKEYEGIDGSKLVASSYQAKYTADQALDGENTTAWHADIDIEGNKVHTVTIELPEPKKIRQVYIAMYEGTTPKINKIYIQGSKDGTEYINLYDVGTNLGVEDITASTVLLENIDYYKFYRVYINGDASYGLGIKNFECKEYWGMKKVYTNNLSLPLTSYEAGKIVNIEGLSYTSLEETLVSGDIIPKTWTAIDDLNYISEEGIQLTASRASEGYDPSRVCDGNISTSWKTGDSSSISTSWVKLKFTKPTKITKMKKKINVSMDKLDNAKIQGSNDDSTWFELFSQGSTDDALTEVTLKNAGHYLYYRLVVTTKKNGTSYLTPIVYEWQASEYFEETEVTVNSFENPYLNINNLGTKLINGTIQAGEKYSLVYNGESWDILVEVVSGTYTGDHSYSTGSGSQVIQLGFTPKAVIVFDTAGRTYAPGDAYNSYYGAIAIRGSVISFDDHPILEIVDGGFEVYFYYNADYSTRILLNTGTRNYIAFK